MTRAAMVALVVLVQFLAPAALAQAPTQPAPASSAADRRQRSLEYFRRVLVEDYDRVGRRDPRWDADARQMLEALARLLAWDFCPDGDEYDILYAAARRVRDAGCSDPMVFFAAARGYTNFTRKTEDFAPLYIESGRRIGECAYSPLLKCMTNLQAAALRGRSKPDARDARREGRRMLAYAMEQLPKALAEPGAPVEAILMLAGLIDDASFSVERDRALVFNETALPLLEQGVPSRSLLLTVKADFLFQHAMDAKRDLSAAGGDQQAAGEARAAFNERLSAALAAAEQAWQADNANAHAAVAMMHYLAERGEGDVPQALETWFTRATASDPLFYAAYSTRLRYLEPKWPGGSTQRMIEFGRECLEAGRDNLDSGIAMLLVEAHLRAACYVNGIEHEDVRPEYFSTGPAVWTDIQAAYEPYLQRHADSVFHRSRYAQLACWAGQLAVAAEQLDALGEDYSLSWFRSRENYLRTRAAAHAGAAAR